MQIINKELLQELLDVSASPCISLYMPTHRHHPENLQDPIHFKNLVKQLEDSLLQHYTPAETSAFLEPFEKLMTDAKHWNYALDGIAVLGAPGYFKVLHLDLPVHDLAIVADSLHTRPLRKYLQTTDRFQVLGISLHDMHFYEGNRHSLIEISLPEESPNTIKKALGEELTEKHLAVTSHGGTGGESGNMHHGHGGKKDEMDVDAERYFRAVSSYINDQFSRPSGLPLILAALPEHHNLFQQVSKNPLLQEKGITINPKAIDLAQMAAMAWEVVEPGYLQKLANLADLFQNAKANELGTDEIAKVVQAAAEGRIDTLLLEAGRLIPGQITDIATGAIQSGSLDHPEVDDLLDDLGQIVTKMGGQVMIIPAEHMPVKTGLAAIFRY